MILWENKSNAPLSYDGIRFVDPADISALAQEATLERLALQNYQGFEASVLKYLVLHSYCETRWPSCRQDQRSRQA